MAKKTAAFIFNIVIALVCAASIAGYFFMPLWKVTASVTVTEELADYIYGEFEKTDAAKESSEDSEIDIKQVVKDALDEMVKDKTSLALSVSFKSQDFLQALIKRDTSAIESAVSGVVDSLLNDITETIRKVIKPVAKAVVKNIATVTIKQTITDYSDENTDVAEVMIELGIDEEYIGGYIDKITDVLFADDATVESVTDEVMVIFDEVYTKLQDSEYSDKLEEVTDEDKEEIREEIAKVLETIADDDGNIDIDALISKYLDEANTNENNGGTADLMPSAYIAHADEIESSTENQSAEDAQTEKEKEDSVEKIKASLRSSVMKALEGAKEHLLYVMMGIGGWVAFTMFTWAYIIIKILFKLFMKNPCVKLKFPIVFGWGTFTLLMLVPNVLVMLVGKVDLFSMLGAETPAALTLVSNAFKLNFFSAGIGSFIAAIALIIIWIFYRPIRNSFKKNKK